MPNFSYCSTQKCYTTVFCSQNLDRLLWTKQKYQRHHQSFPYISLKILFILIFLSLFLVYVLIVLVICVTIFISKHKHLAHPWKVTVDTKHTQWFFRLFQEEKFHDKRHARFPICRVGKYIQICKIKLHSTYRYRNNPKNM